MMLSIYLLSFAFHHNRLGFHWAPFNSIGHLHLHLLYPTDQMSLISRLVFQPNWFWFAEVRAHETLMRPPPVPVPPVLLIYYHC